MDVRPWRADNICDITTTPANLTAATAAAATAAAENAVASLEGAGVFGRTRVCLTSFASTFFFFFKNKRTPHSHSPRDFFKKPPELSLLVCFYIGHLTTTAA